MTKQEAKRFIEDAVVSIPTRATITIRSIDGPFESACAEECFEELTKSELNGWYEVGFDVMSWIGEETITAHIHEATGKVMEV